MYNLPDQLTRFKALHDGGRKPVSLLLLKSQAINCKQAYIMSLILGEVALIAAFSPKQLQPQHWHVVYRQVCSRYTLASVANV